jgi:hypothetical protein
MSLNVNPDIEARLIALAHSSGVSVEDFLRHVVEEKTGETTASRPAYELPPEEWVRRFEAWTRSHEADNLPLLSDDDISRESIYRERGL